MSVGIGLLESKVQLPPIHKDGVGVKDMIASFTVELEVVMLFCCCWASEVTYACSHSLGFSKLAAESEKWKGKSRLPCGIL